MDTTTPAAPASGASAAGPEDALDQLLRQIITGFFVLTDGHGAVSKWSEPAELLFGVEADDALMEPFFDKLIPPTGLSPEGEAWRRFLETGETGGTAGRLLVDAHRPGGGTFAMEAVFVPVKLDEGFDFSLFLEDLDFELPIDMMLRRMRQQHPVVIRALRAALDPTEQAWDGSRAAGTLVTFRALEETPWMDEAISRRAQEAAEAEAELQERLVALEPPGVHGADIYDLEDARAVIERLRWATERIEDLEERSRVSEHASKRAADARVRAEAAERAALDVKDEVSGALADRRDDSAVADARADLAGRIDALELRAAGEAAAVQAANAALAARVQALSDDRRVEDEVHAIRREQEELRASLEELRRDRDEARAQLRDAARAAEEARALVERDPRTGDAGGPRPATGDEVRALAKLEADERDVEALRTEVRAALATVQEFKQGFEEARQAAVSARLDAEQALAAATKAGAASEATAAQFTEVWQKILSAPPRPGSGVHGRPPAGPGTTTKPAPAPPARPPRAGFDDDARPLAVLDLKGRFTDLNPAFAKLVGYREDEFAKATWPSVLDRRLYREQKGELDEMVAGARERAQVKSTYMHGQGLMVLITGVVELVRDETGEPRSLLLIADSGGPSS